MESALNLAYWAAQQYAHAHTDRFEEFVAVASLGIVDAATRYDASAGAKFSTFAAKRAKGAILDHIRATTPGSRSQQKLKSAARKATEQLSQSLAGTPSIEDIASHLGVKPHDLERLSALETVHLSALLDDNGQEYFEEMLHTNTSMPHEELLHLDELLPLVREDLSDRFLTIFAQFMDQQDFATIAKTHGITESRISQIINYEVIPLLRKAQAALDTEGDLADQLKISDLYGILPPLRSAGKQRANQETVSTLLDILRSSNMLDSCRELTTWLNLLQQKAPLGVYSAYNLAATKKSLTVLTDYRQLVSASMRALIAGR